MTAAVTTTAVSAPALKETTTTTTTTISYATDDIEARIDSHRQLQQHGYLQRWHSLTFTKALRALASTTRASAARVAAAVGLHIRLVSLLLTAVIIIISSSSSWFLGYRTVLRATTIGTLLSLSFFAQLACSSPLFYCHRLDTNPRRLYATKTSYSDVRNQHSYDETARDDAAETKNTTHDDGTMAMHGCCQYERDLGNRHNNSLINGLIHCRQSAQTNPEKDECEPVSVYLLARHGTRFNKLSNMNKMSEHLRRIQALIETHASRGTMCEEDLNWLNEWKPRHSIHDDSKLSNSGWNELLEIGQRYGELFAKILRRNYSPSLYEFRYTNYTGKGDRTRQSARAFAEGLWGAFQNVEMIENPRPDWLLQFYEHCDKYLRIVSANPVEDYEKFKIGPEMTEVIDNVNKRLGLPANTLGFHDVYLIFENCRLEHGLYRDAPWCSVLTPSMLEVIEYHQDVKYYWEDGYGHLISYEPACTLVRDILLHLEDETKLGRFRFAHSGTLDALYTRIGLFEDEEPLRATNFAHHRSRRRWMTSRSTPMAANIAFIKYRCLQTPTLRVKTVVNENIRRPVIIPGCLDPLCPLDTLRAVWQPIADDCDIERICEQNQGTSAAATTTREVADAGGDVTSGGQTTSSSNSDFSAVA